MSDNRTDTRLADGETAAVAAPTGSAPSPEGVDFSQMQLFLGDAALLLSYPDAVWRELVGSVETDLDELSEQDAQALSALIGEAQAADTLAFQAAYVETFDFGKGANLYLASGEGAEASARSVDMLGFSLYYQESGYEPAEESPDYLPALLELASAVDADEAKRILRGCAHGLSQIHDELNKAGRDAYATVTERVLHYAQMYESEVAA